MVNAVEQQIAADAITSKPTEKQLREYYRLHPSRYASEGIMSVRDLVFAVDDPRAVLAAKAMAFQEPTQEILTQWHASEPRKAVVEEFYFAAKIHLGDGLFDAARTLSDGDVSAPLPQPDGIHLLYMIKNKRPVAYDFDAARDQVLRDFRDEAIGRLRSGDEKFLRQRANISIAADVH